MLNQRAKLSGARETGARETGVRKIAVGWVLMLVLVQAVGFQAVGLQSVQARDTDPMKAFEGFIVSGDLKSAHFYLENNLLPPEKIETSRLFVEAVFKSNSGNGGTAPFAMKQLPSIELLYNYLGAIQPIDLNGLHRCNRVGANLNNDYVCNLATFLFSIGASPTAFDFFQQRGMNTQSFSKDTLPPIVVLISKLGVDYGLTELNWFANNGAPLGAETYSADQLGAWGGLIQRGYRSVLPADKPATSAYNFTDILTLSLANSNYRRRDLNRHRDFLCRYIAHVASQNPPSFDHFSYLLLNVDEFRASKIGQASHPSQWGAVNRAVFPHSCRVLLEAMGRSSKKLDAMITHFSGAADLETAQWLVSLKQSKGDSNAQSN